MSGYATASMAKMHLGTLASIELNPIVELTIGMAKSQGLSMIQHEGLKKVSQSPSFSCKYWGKFPPIHAKVYAWLKDKNPIIAFTGSANYTQNGFGKNQREILTEVDPIVATHWCNKISYESYSCQDDEIETIISFHRNYQENKHPDIHDLETVILPLHLKNERKVPLRSGLNWGQREGRNPNQAYISIPSALQHGRSDFFPPRKGAFYSPHR